jgi:hypothetical protein
MGPPACHYVSVVQLRNAQLAVVERSKVLDYLLNEAHPDNGGKARFFTSLGFSAGEVERLIDALADVAKRGEVVQIAVATAAVLPSSVVNSTSSAFPSAVHTTVPTSPTSRPSAGIRSVRTIRSCSLIISNLLADTGRVT